MQPKYKILALHREIVLSQDIITWRDQSQTQAYIGAMRKKMNEELIRSCQIQVSIWRSLLEHGEITNPLLNNAEYKAALLSLSESLGKVLEGHVEDDDQKEQFLLHLILSGTVDSAKDGMSDLRGWLNGAKKVTICDPYFLHFQPSDLYRTVEDYAAGLVKIFPASVTDIDVFSNSYTTSVRRCVMKKLKMRRSVRHFSSHEIHDRFVIKDGKEGRLVGTSFGGFGRKFFAMIDLPHDDVRDVISELRELCPKPVGSRR